MCRTVVGLVVSLLILTGTAAAQAPLPLYVARPVDFHPVPGGKVTYSPGPGQTVLLTPGIHAFTAFEAAVAAANSNAQPRNTIIIGPGTFDVAVAQITIAKNLTVIGAGTAATTIRPTVGLLGVVHSAFIVIQPNAAVQLTQLTIDGQAPAAIGAAPSIDVGMALYFSTTFPHVDPVPSLIDHVAIRNIRLGDPAVSARGTAIGVEAGRVTISQSAFSNMGAATITFGIVSAVPNSNLVGTVLGNTFTGKGSGNTYDNGLEVGGQAVVTIEGNTFTNILGEHGSARSSAIVAYALGVSPTVTIRRNTMDNNREAIRVGLVSSDTTQLTITENNITNNASFFAITSPRPSSLPFGAPNNFWGSPLGPFNATNNPTGDPGNHVTFAVMPIAPIAATAFAPTFTPPPASIASLQGTIGGAITRADTHAPQAGVTVFLDINGNSQLDEGEVATTTNAAGTYAFSNLPVAEAGRTYIVIVPPTPFHAEPNPQAAELTPSALAATRDFVVTPVVSTTTALASPNPVQHGQTVLLTATVAPGSATGLVTFHIDGTNVGAAPLTAGQATLTVEASSLSAGTHEVIASFGGSATLAGSTSAPVTLTVGGGAAAFTQYFAEGATGFFQTTIGVLNASDTDPAHVTVSLFPERGATVVVPFTLNPLTRRTIDLNAVLGDVAGVSTQIEADRSIAATRQMTWGQPVHGSTLESGIATASPTWYFAEGATGAFSLFFLVENPGSVAADVTFTHLLEGGGSPIAHTTVVPAYARRTVLVDAVAGLAAAALSTVVTSNVPIVAERAMYLNTTARLWEGGTAGRGATALSSSWSFAEGATGFFQTYLLLGNPNGDTTTATVRYQLPDGTTIEKAYPIAGQSRRTIDVQAEDARLASTAVAMTVATTLPIVAERAMWWGNPWTEGSGALGTTGTGTVWGIGEGAVGGADDESTFVLVSNGIATPGIVRLTVVYDDGTRERREYPLAAHARLTVPIAADFSLSIGRRFSVLVESLTAGVPITVEYARYQSAASFLDAGGAALATRIR